MGRSICLVIFKQQHDFIQSLHSAAGSKKSLFGFGNRQTSWRAVKSPELTVFHLRSRKMKVQLSKPSSSQAFCPLSGAGYTTLFVELPSPGTRTKEKIELFVDSCWIILYRSLPKLNFVKASVAWEATVTKQTRPQTDIGEESNTFIDLA